MLKLICLNEVPVVRQKAVACFVIVKPTLIMIINIFFSIHVWFAKCWKKDPFFSNVVINCVLLLFF